MPECCDPAHGWDQSCVDYVNQFGCSGTGDYDVLPACFPDGSCAFIQKPFLEGGQTFGDMDTQCQGDQDGDGIDDACGCPTDVPALSSHGMIVGAVLLLVISVWFLLWRRRATS
jgi:hypothetical protein